MGSAASLSPRDGRAVSERASFSRAANAPDPAPGCGPAFQIHHPGVAGPHQRGVPVPSGAVPQVSAGGPPWGPGGGPGAGRAGGCTERARPGGGVRLAAEPARGPPGAARGARAAPGRARAPGRAGRAGGPSPALPCPPLPCPALRGPVLPRQLPKLSWRKWSLRRLRVFEKTQYVLGARTWRGHFSISGEDLRQFCGTAH